MAIRVKYQDGTTELIAAATRVDQQNFHEGMYDFYDERGTLLKQIGMGEGITWEDVLEGQNGDQAESQTGV